MLPPGRLCEKMFAVWQAGIILPASDRRVVAAAFRDV
jgi:hypothetical protein